MRHFDWIAHHARRRPARVAAHDLASDRAHTYRAFDARIDGVAAELEARGIGAGARVAVLAHGSTDVLEVQFACARLGALFVPLNWRLSPRELAAIAADAEPSLWVLDRALAHLVEGLDGPRLDTDGLGGDSDYERAATSGRRPRRPITAALEDTGALLYTSGTTGRPKGARITHAMTFFNAINLAGPARIGPDSVNLAALPLFHTGGLNCYTNVVFHAGGTNLVMRTWEPARALAWLGDPARGVTHFFGVPAHYQAMAEQPEFARARLGLITAGVGGAPCPRPMLELWSARGVPMQQGYGLTETGPTVLVLDTDRALEKLGSAGLPALHVEVQLARPDGTPTEGLDEIGEIWVRGPGISPGYWGQPPPQRPGGWLATGDAARRDADGFYFIVDRWKDMYISGGENVYPAEVEAALHQLDGVVEAAVVGVSDARWGEVGAAFVVLRAGVVLDEAAVLEHCRAHLARYKAPRQVTFVDALPRNASGKVLKGELRARASRAQ